MIKTYSLVHYHDKRFAHFYNYNHANKEFRTADFPRELPDDGVIMLDCMGRVVGMSISVLKEDLQTSQIHEAFWAYKKPYAKFGVKLTNDMISSKKNVCYFGKIFKDGLKEHKAALIASRSIGFKVVAQDDGCYIVKREV